MKKKNFIPLYLIVFASLCLVVGLLQLGQGQSFFYITWDKLTIRLFGALVITYVIARRIKPKDEA